jgi:rubrerythrin
MPLQEEAVRWCCINCRYERYLDERPKECPRCHKRDKYFHGTRFVNIGLPSDV